jgi:hypothetical protein
LHFFCRKQTNQERSGKQADKSIPRKDVPVVDA